jgi:phosphoserine phosphatase
MAKGPKFDAVCFDCDSTLTRIEGIDELARRSGCEAKIASLTEAAMNGAIPLEAVYAKRLDLVRPDRAALAWLAGRYTDEMVSGAAETIATPTKASTPARRSVAATARRSSAKGLPRRTEVSPWLETA